jgi:hypothetical protein
MNLFRTGTHSADAACTRFLAPKAHPTLWAALFPTLRKHPFRQCRFCESQFCCVIVGYTWVLGIDRVSTCFPPRRDTFP